MVLTLILILTNTAKCNRGTGIINQTQTILETMYC